MPAWLTCKCRLTWVAGKLDGLISWASSSLRFCTLRARKMCQTTFHVCQGMIHWLGHHSYAQWRVHLGCRMAWICLLCMSCASGRYCAQLVGVDTWMRDGLLSSITFIMCASTVEWLLGPRCLVLVCRLCSQMGVMNLIWASCTMWSACLMTFPSWSVCEVLVSAVCNYTKPTEAPGLW